VKKRRRHRGSQPISPLCLLRFFAAVHVDAPCPRQRDGAIEKYAPQKRTFSFSSSNSRHGNENAETTRFAVALHGVCAALQRTYLFAVFCGILKFGLPASIAVALRFVIDRLAPGVQGARLIRLFLSLDGRYLNWMGDFCRASFRPSRRGDSSTS
jgi:hypothetical protein